MLPKCIRFSCSIRKYVYACVIAGILSFSFHTITCEYVSGAITVFVFLTFSAIIKKIKKT